MYTFPKGWFWLILLPINSRCGEAFQMKETCWNIAVFSLCYEQKQPTFWRLHLIYYFSVLRSYFTFLKNIVSTLVAKFVVWQELSWLLKLNIICGSEVISLLFYSDFKSRLSPFCAVEQGLLFRNLFVQDFIKIW